MTDSDAVLHLVDRLAGHLPGVARLAIFDVVEEEWARLCAAVEPAFAPLVAPAALWRLRPAAGGVTPAHPHDPFSESRYR